MDDADWFGSGEFYFIASVDGQPVGDRRRLFDARQGAWIALNWRLDLDVTGKTQVVVRFQGKDQDLFFDDDLGTIQYTVRPPWSERNFNSRTEHFLLEWGVELEVAGAFGHHPPNEVFACRNGPGNLDCTTVSGVPIVARLEIHPVRPVPPTGLPPRGLPPGSLLAVENRAATNVNPADAINIIPNPAVIPILSAPGSAPAAGAPPAADVTNAARIEYTFYRPNTLAFTDQDPRLEWSARPLTGGAVGFVGAARGLKVFVYGTAAGQVLLEVKFRGEILATYRAVVAPMKSIPCRFNILNGPTAASQPRSTPADVQVHLAIANRFLRQAALELVLDSNAHVTNGATTTAVPGIFRIKVPATTTRNFNPNVVALPATRLNYRQNVMNFAYVHSDRFGNLGAATDFPASNVAPAAPGARPTVTDAGTPSSSWISPTGVPPDAAAAAVTLQLITARQRPGHPRLFAMYVTDSHGDPTQIANQRNIANTIVHELLHILNLGHRVEGADATQPTGLAANGIFWDGLNYPPQENIMHFNAPGTIAQDIDIVQALAARQSPLVPP